LSVKTVFVARAGGVRGLVPDKN